MQTGSLTRLNQIRKHSLKKSLFEHSRFEIQNKCDHQAVHLPFGMLHLIDDLTVQLVKEIDDWCGVKVLSRIKSDLLVNQSKRLLEILSMRLL